MFPYHNRLKQLLNLYRDSYIVVKEKAPFVYRFIFPEINKSMSIREHRIAEYRDWIRDWEQRNEDI
jgi:hypothetical protein